MRRFEIKTAWIAFDMEGIGIVRRVRFTRRMYGEHVDFVVDDSPTRVASRVKNADFLMCSWIFHTHASENGLAERLYVD
jgi:hypothetical protein